MFDGLLLPPALADPLAGSPAESLVESPVDSLSESPVESSAESLAASPELSSGFTLAVCLLDVLPLPSSSSPPDPPPQPPTAIVRMAQNSMIATRLNMDRSPLHEDSVGCANQTAHCGILNNQNSPSGFDQRQPGGHGALLSTL
ncbi:hypothetical protein [Salinisphaera sp.]|uniref:hypothetical protein n=1 Tax=Salinisphaera sp. TaxID=1914330 RepID=UPI002D79C4D9|nr:hypothetical protein [Salinisphaera sp.]HET7313007.1 hypothetical protein [Salinisphaera sp.]